MSLALFRGHCVTLCAFTGMRDRAISMERMIVSLKRTYAMKIFAALLAFFLMSCGSAHAQDWARTELEKSSRHAEWVTIKNGDRNIRSFIVYPEVKNKAKAVVVIHEIFGLSDWVRLTADKLAAAGYIAIAPDLLSGSGAKRGGTEDFASEDAVRKAVSGLDPEKVTSDLNAVTNYVAKLPAANGKVAVSGFCWGGTQAFRFATNNQKLKAAFVFYGTGPEKAEDLQRINVPVYGFYAENDARVDATLAATKTEMKKAKKTFEPVTYAKAGHGFMRAGEAPDAKEANRNARASAWVRWKKQLVAM